MTRKRPAAADGSQVCKRPASTHNAIVACPRPPSLLQWLMWFWVARFARVVLRDYLLKFGSCQAILEWDPSLAPSAVIVGNLDEMVLLLPDTFDQADLRPLL